MPFYANLVPYLSHLPSFLRDLAQKVGLSRLPFLLGTDLPDKMTGADYAMVNFVKHSSRRPEEGDVLLQTSKEGMDF